MDLNERIILGNIESKMRIMKGMELNDDEINASFSAIEKNILEKAFNHKYIRKEGQKYIYEEPKVPEGSKMSDEEKEARAFDEEHKKGGSYEKQHNADQKKIEARGKQPEEKSGSEGMKTSDVKVGDFVKIKDYWSKKYSRNTYRVSKIDKDEIEVKWMKENGSTETKKFGLGQHRDEGSFKIAPEDSGLWSFEEWENWRNKVKKGTDSSITKSEDSKERKVALVMREFKDGKLKSSSGDSVTDRDQAIAIALSEAGLSKGEVDESGLEKGVYIDDAENRKLGRVGQKYGVEDEALAKELKVLEVKEKEVAGVLDKLFGEEEDAPSAGAVRNIRAKIEIQVGLLQRIQGRQEKVKRLLKGAKN